MKIAIIIENEKEMAAIINAACKEYEKPTAYEEIRHDITMDLGGIKITSNHGYNMDIEIKPDALCWLAEKVGRSYFMLSDAITESSLEQARSMEGWGDYFTDQVLTIDGKIVNECQD